MVTNISENQFLTEDIVVPRIAADTNSEANSMKRFQTKAKEWLKDYKELCKQHNRTIPLFVDSDDRDFLYLLLLYYSAYRPVTSFVIPYQSKLLESPLQAFRFVSLIPFEYEVSSYGIHIERWHTFHSLLTKGLGNLRDHCSLLCSLLLGFGLDAYVAVGTKKGKIQFWVITRESMVSIPVKTVYFWEPMSGKRYEITNPRVTNYYNSLNCVFNNRILYGNIQNSNRIESI